MSKNHLISNGFIIHRRKGMMTNNKICSHLKISMIPFPCMESGRCKLFAAMSYTTTHQRHLALIS